MKKDYIPSLTGLRAISIFMVIAYHLDQRGFFPNNNLFKYAGWVFFNGPLGVNIFFIISGFLITSLLIAEKVKNGFISLKNFYVRRIIRIFPAYYAFVAILIIFQWSGYFHFPLPAWVSLLTYTKQFFPFYGHEIEHLWSLSVEEFFYLFWPLCFIRIRKLEAFVIVMICVFTISRFVFFEYPLAKFTNSIFVTGDALLIGCLIALRLVYFKNLILRLGKLNLFIPLFICISISIRNYFYHFGEGNETGKFNSLLYLQKASYALFGSIGLVTNLLIGVFIIYCVYSRGVVYRILNTAFLIYIGTLSYSIYLWQQLFTADRDWLHHLSILIILLLIFTTGMASYYLIEKPFLRFKKYFETGKLNKNNIILHVRS